MMEQTTQPKHLVLYADDDVDDIKFVEDAFSETTQNVELVTAYDGVEAVNYLQSLSTLDASPCLIILDLNMPRLNGKEALEKIRKMERFKTTPVVLFTTSSLEPDRRFAEKYNAGFITKPLDSRQMSLITTQFIEHCTDDIKKNIRRALTGNR